MPDGSFGITLKSFESDICIDIMIIMNQYFIKMESARIKMPIPIIQNDSVVSQKFLQTDRHLSEFTFYST